MTDKDELMQSLELKPPIRENGWTSTATGNVAIGHKNGEAAPPALGVVNDLVVVGDCRLELEAAERFAKRLRKMIKIAKAEAGE